MARNEVEFYKLAGGFDEDVVVVTALPPSRHGPGRREPGPKGLDKEVKILERADLFRNDRWHTLSNPLPRGKPRGKAQWRPPSQPPGRAWDCHNVAESRFAPKAAPAKVSLYTFAQGINHFEDITSLVSKAYDSLLVLDLRVTPVPQL
ncbi:hypothetical protein PG987_002030 [Apiospora arundinis]